MDDLPDLEEQDDLALGLDTCDREPIHIPGSIQPFGAVLAGPMALTRIDYCSVNLEAFLAVPATDVLGTAFEDLLGDEIVHDARNMLSLSTARTQRERLGIYALPQGRFEVYAHLNPSDQAVIELERAPDATGHAPIVAVDKMRKFLAAASARDSVQGLLDMSVVGLQDMTGYDRVVAYKYAENGDGEVVAEMRNDGVDSFLGLRYPAWDVPAQARALQVRNPLRMLADVAQTPVPILAASADSPPLDLSLAHLRGISPIHVEYLANMGVGASLTVGIVVEGKLWGMFACHHRAPRIITSDLRIAVELFGQMISLIIKQKLDVERQRTLHRATAARERILAETDATVDLLHAFPQMAPILFDVIRCDGLALVYEGKVLTVGSTPSQAAIRSFAAYKPDTEDLIEQFDSIKGSPIEVTGDLQDSAGAMLVRSTSVFPLQLVFFRDEIVRKLTWAGRPEKEIAPGPFGPRITPRGSFAAYVESKRDMSESWSPADETAARELQVLLTQMTAKGERAQLLRHKDLVNHQRQQDLMIAELNHRVKNILALIKSLSRQAKSSSASLESYARALEQRIAALASAHDLAVSNTMQGVSLRGILELELSPYLGKESSQIILQGPLVGLRPDVAPMVALVLHEMVSNAVKYGALSTPDGVIQVRWANNDGVLELEWRELGGPEVTPPERHGFGRSLIEKAIPYELDGEARLSFDPGGVRFSFTLPAETLVALDDEAQQVRIVGTVAEVPRAAHGTRALLVEDNMVLAMDMVDSLTRLGTKDVETAGTLDKGLALARQVEIDFAVLDLNLRGTVSFAIAEALADRGIPFLFVSGYGSSIDIPKDLSHVPILTKPIDEGTLSKTIAGLLGM